MPSGGLQARSEQIAEMSSLIHEEKTSVSYKALLEQLVHLKSGTLKGKHLKTAQRIIIREWRKDFLRANKLPSSFVGAFAQLTAESSQIWAMAKKEKNFKLFAPFLEKIIRMNREKADILGYSDHPYDALLENYEPSLNSAKVSTLFKGLQKELVHLIQKIGDAKAPDTKFLHRTVEAEKQQELAHWIAAAMPCDPAYTRLDVSSHPFSMAIHPHDSRITTRYLPNNFMSNIFSVLHEAGHSMYEMGLPLKHFGTPLCQYASLSVHESQSRLWETLIGRSLPFWEHFYPQLQKKLPAILGKVNLNKFYRAIHSVHPSFIRVEADEVTYCLHVILRFEIEKELISGALSVHDLPEAWNTKFVTLFGIKPPDVAQGCLQDIHWSLGDFGYFPTYALGNLLAAHLFSAFSKQHRDWEEQVVKGELAFIRAWLEKNVHQWGRTYDYNELGKKATGKPVDEKAFCQYLKKKYTAIYDL
jgi:carboxypeptidase Taq